LIFGVLTPISTIFQLYHGDQERSRKEPPTMGKQLVNFIIAAASRVHPFL